MADILAARRDEYKKTIHVPRREDRRAMQESSRRAKRDRMLLAKRRSTLVATDAPVAAEPVKYTKEQCEGAVAALRGPAGDERASAVSFLRKVLAIQVDPPIKPLVSIGIVPPLVKLMNTGTDTEKLDAAWCCANIATGSYEETGKLMEAVPTLIGLASSGNPVLAEQAAWALGNIAGDCGEYRDKLSRSGALKPLIDLMASKKRDVAFVAVWATANMAKGHDTSAEPFVKLGAIKNAKALLKAGPRDQDMAIEVAWLFTFLTTREPEALRLILEAGMLEVFAPMMESKNHLLVTPVLRTLGNMAWAGDYVVDAMLAMKPMLPTLLGLIRQGSEGKTTGAAAWVLSNLAGGKRAHAEMIVGHGFLPALAPLLEGGFFVKREAARALHNILQHGFVREVLGFDGVLKGVLSLFGVPDIECQRLALSFVGYCLKTGDKETIRNIEELGGVEALEALSEPEDPSNRVLCDMAVGASFMVDKYYGTDCFHSDDDDVADFASPSSPVREGGRGRGRGRGALRPAWETRGGGSVPGASSIAPPPVPERSFGGGGGGAGGGTFSLEDPGTVGDFGPDFGANFGEADQPAAGKVQPTLERFGFGPAV